MARAAVRDGDMVADIEEWLRGGELRPGKDGPGGAGCGGDI